MNFRLDVDPEEYGDRERIGRRRSRIPIIPLVVAIVMVGSAGVLWLAYQYMGHSSSSGPVPTLHADEGPTKVRPDQPGGMPIPDMDKFVLNKGRPSDTKVEQLLPPPETPLPRPTPPPPAAEPEPPAAPATPPAPTAAPAPPPVAASPAPAPVAAPPPAPAPRAQPQATAAPVAPPAAGKGGYRLQLGSVKSAEAAKQGWERIKHQNGDLLGALGFSAVRADLGERGVFYRIQAGPVGDAAEAERTCNELKRRNLGCILVRP